jgi:hypothetical protein
LALEAFDFAAAVRVHDRPRWPWLFGDEETRGEKWNAFGLWLTATAFRVGAGAATSAAYVSGGEVNNEMVAFGLGASGQAALERLIAVAKRPKSSVARQKK